MYSIYRKYMMNGIKAHQRNNTFKFTSETQYYVELFTIKKDS